MHRLGDFGISCAVILIHTFCYLLDIIGNRSEILVTNAF